ncbi:MAG: hypothetical protein R2788_06940 [Saprospiraceae bacterium]
MVIPQRIQDQPYEITAAAMEDVELSIYFPKDFLQLLHADRNVSSRFVKMLAENIIDKEEQLLQLAYDSIRKRVAEALLTLQEREGSNILPDISKTSHKSLHCQGERHPHGFWNLKMTDTSK